MTAQLTFDDAPRLRKHFASIEERFQVFHRKHPEIYELLVRYAREARHRRRRFGIRALWEIMRWNENIAESEEDFKLNDHFPAHYARMIMEKESDLKDFFETRRLRA